MTFGRRVLICALSFLTFFILAGCTSKTNEADLPYRFTVGPFGLGMAKDTIRGEETLKDCKPRNRLSAVCLSGKVGSDAKFFGRPTKSVELDFAAPYTHLTSIKAVVSGKPIDVKELAKVWTMDGQCLTKDEIQAAVEQDNGASSYALEILSKIGSLPKGASDFVCIREDDHLRYTWDEGAKEATVLMVHSDSMVLLNYEYIFKAVDSLRANQERINTQFSAKKGKPESKQCSVFAEMDGEKRDELMAKLADRVKASKISYRGLSNFISEICNESSRADWAVEWGALTPDQAVKIAKEMGVSYMGPTDTSPFAPRYNKAMDSLTTVGLCNACTYRPAMKYAMEPHSECASYVSELMAAKGEKAERIKQILETDEAMCR